MVTVCHAQLLPILGFVKVSHITLNLIITTLTVSHTEHSYYLTPAQFQFPAIVIACRMSQLRLQIVVNHLNPISSRILECVA